MRHAGSFRRTVVAVALMAMMTVGLVSAAPAAGAVSQSCKKMSGRVLLTYHNPTRTSWAPARG